MAMMCKLAWSGRITDGTSTGSAQVEIFSNQTWLLLVDDSNLPVALGQIAPLLATFWSGSDTGIHSTAIIDEVKLNEYNPLTGLQETDPTVRQAMQARGGTTTSVPPLTTSMRVSLDNETRNARARGGFFLPRVALSIGTNGRFAQNQVNLVRSAAVLMLQGILNIPAVTEVGVYSKAAQGFFPSTRVRVGDVPDNVRRRKNALQEQYSVGSISP